MATKPRPLGIVLALAALACTVLLGAPSAVAAPSANVNPAESTSTTTTGDVSTASWYLAYTGTAGVNLRGHACATPQPYCGYNGSISANGTPVRIVCQVSGQSVSGVYGTSSIWDYVVVYDGTPQRNEGFVADANMNTGHNWIPGVDICGTS